MPIPLDNLARRKAGPGLVEAFFWTLIYLLAQILAFALFLVFFVYAAFHEWPATSKPIIDLMLEIELDRSFVPLGVSNLLCLFILIPAVRLRIGSRFRQELKLKRPAGSQVLLVAGSILPLSIVSEQLYRWSLDLWAMAATSWPAVARWSQANAVDAMMRFARDQPYPVLVMAIALGPAIGEEFIFRGLIGNGLVRRWGVRTGMLLTSLFFAGAHGFPPHALATIPIGLYLHYVYLASQSLWLPVLVHFLNNMLIITLARYSLVERLPASPVVVVCAAAFVIMTARFLDRELHEAAPEASMRPSWNAAWNSMRAHGVTAAAVVAFTAAFVWTAFAGS